MPYPAYRSPDGTAAVASQSGRRVSSGSPCPATVTGWPSAAAPANSYPGRNLRLGARSRAVANSFVSGRATLAAASPIVRVRCIGPRRIRRALSGCGGRLRPDPRPRLRIGRLPRIPLVRGVRPRCTGQGSLSGGDCLRLWNDGIARVPVRNVGAPLARGPFRRIVAYPPSRIGKNGDPPPLRPARPIYRLLAGARLALRHQIVRGGAPAPTA